MPADAVTNSRRKRRASGLEALRPLSAKQRATRVLAAWLFAVASCHFLDSSTIFRALEADSTRLLQNTFAQLGGTKAERARSRVVIVTLSDDTYSQQREHVFPGPPMPRNYHARVVRKLTQAGAKVIAFDLLFDAPRPTDKLFAKAAKESGRVLWACIFDHQGTSQQKLVTANPQLLHASPHIGHIQVPIGNESHAVDYIEAVRYEKKTPIPSLSLSAVLMARGLEPQPLRADKNGKWRSGDVQIPLDATGGFEINYLGTLAPVAPGYATGFSTNEGRDIFGIVSYEDVYEKNLETDFPDFFRDKIVLIGDITTSGNDHLFTPLGEMNGVEIHAHAINTLMEGAFSRAASPLLNFAALCLMTVLACPLASLRRLPIAALGVAVLLGGYFFGCAWLFVNRNFSLHTVAPMAGAVTVSLLILAGRVLVEEREKNRFNQLLRRYVSPQVADYVIANPDRCVLGGERVLATVLFSDIRGFTALSENLLPEEVVARLNEYLQAMTDVVFRHDGTLDKYVGDAVMALFGVPVPHDDAARRAVATAIDMQSALLELQEKWRREGLPLIDIGIGINTGEMVVGNMGAVEHMDFTVIGDAVNLASRVESLNKEMGSRILVTAQTYEIVKDEVSTRGPLMARVKGKDEEVAVYEVFGWKASSDAL
jgi:adenylate cyclase